MPGLLLLILVGEVNSNFSSENFVAGESLLRKVGSTALTSLNLFGTWVTDLTPLQDWPNGVIIYGPLRISAVERERVEKYREKNNLPMFEFD
jgi:hypothetical protein